MGKSVLDAVLDAALNYVKTNGNKLTVCTSEPTTYAKATNTPATSSGYRLADVVTSAGDYTGPANGDTSGRKVTVAAQSSISVDATGTAAHVAIVDTSSSALLYVTTCTSQSLTSGNKVNTPAWDIEIRDPS